MDTAGGSEASASGMGSGGGISENKTGGVSPVLTTPCTSSPSRHSKNCSPVSKCNGASVVPRDSSLWIINPRFSVIV
jgi:hypothetical protein